MQIIGSFQIVTDVTSVVPTFLSCIALLGFASFAFRFLILLALLECAGGISLLRERRGRCPSTLQAFDKGKACFRCRSNFSSKSKQA